VTDQPQNGPTERAGPESEPTGGTAAARGPDAPTDVQPVDEAQLPAVPEAPAVPPPPPSPAVPPPPPPSAVSPPPPPTVGQAGFDSAWRPEDEPSRSAALAAERPEVAVGAAFAGGLVLALILKRLAR
jgi:hypothetical protein